MSYKVLFIDEESTQHDDFKDHFEENWSEAVCECLFPARTIEEMIYLLEKKHPDAVIVDYQLNNKKEDISYNVGYNGVELLNAIHNQLADFPCFVITSYDGEAVVDSDDVNLIYVKKVLRFSSADGEKVSFAQRVKSQIDKYRMRIDNARKELSILIEKREKGNATVQDEERIVELDTFLEKTYGKEDAVPSELKHISNLEKLNTLIDKVDCLINKLS